MNHVAFFGDGEKSFALTHPLIIELERKTGYGIGSIFTRIQARQFGIAEINEIVRLGLIGGGTSPAEAAALVDTYVINRPLGEGLALALGILGSLFFGSDEPASVDDAAATGDLSAAVNADYEAFINDGASV